MGLEHIGQKLKSARDGLGLSLSQIHERTKIPFNHLQAIDNGQDEDLPEPVYVSGFIKRYAECVGLNGQQLVEEYREELEGTTNNSNGGFQFLPRGHREPQIVAPPPTNYFNKTRIEQPPPNLFKLVLFPACFVVAALALMIFLANRQQTAEVAQDPSLTPLKDAAKFTGLPTPPPTATTETTPSAQTPVTSDNPPASSTPPVASKDARVTLTGLRRVWIEVKSESSGETKYSGFLDTGDQRDFQDSEGLRIVAGSGGNLSVEANGKTETFGVAGKRTERVFLSKGAAAAAEKTAEKPAESDNQSSKTTTANASTTVKKPPAPKKSIASKDHSANRRVDNLPSRQYIPGESLGSGTKAIDVPYRY